MENIILDCDPGHDDAVAIILAGKADNLNLLGISVVAGNQTLDNTSRNALNITQHLGLDVPVYAGCDRPMVREKIIAADIHGSTGLDGPVFPPLKKKLEEKHSVLFLVDTLMEAKEPITIVTTGPMTNLGMAIRLQPEITKKIKRIVLMGGSYTNGNVSPAAEFNIIADAEAAHICFTSGVPITMVGLDVTRQALCKPEIVERMRKLDNKASHLFVDMMSHFNRAQKEIFGWEGGPLHDPITVAYLINPKVLVTKPMNVQIDHGDGISYGRTNCDIYDYAHLPHTAEVAMEIDVELFWDIVEQEMRKYN